MVDTIMNAQKDITSSTSAVPSVATQTAVAIPGQPLEQLEIEESGSSEDEVVYPTGTKLWLNVGSFMVVNFVRSVDITVVAVAVSHPRDPIETSETLVPLFDHIATAPNNSAGP